MNWKSSSKHNFRGVVESLIQISPKEVAAGKLLDRLVLKFGDELVSYIPKEPSGRGVLSWGLMVSAYEEV